MSDAWELETAVAQWRAFVEKVEEGYPLGLAEYSDELRNRDVIQEEIELYPDHERGTRAKVLSQEWDERFLAATEPWPDLESWLQLPVWFVRLPHALAGPLAEDARALPAQIERLLDIMPLLAEAALQPWSEAQFRTTLATMQAALPEAEFEWAEGREKWAMFLGEDEVVAILHVDTPLALVHRDLVERLEDSGIVLAPFPNWGLPSYRIDYAEAVRLLPDWNWEPDMKDHPIRVAMPMNLYLNTV